MRVGTSIDKLGGTNNDGDHPHACGDKKSPAVLTAPITGSSPCVWGQDNAYLSTKKALRIIPMRVGTSFTNAFNEAID